MGILTGLFLGKLLFDGSKVEGGHLGLRRNIKSSDHPIKPVVKENLENPEDLKTGSPGTTSTQG